MFTPSGVLINAHVSRPNTKKMSIDIVIQTGIISQLNPPNIDVVTPMMEIPTDNDVIIFS